MSLIQFNQVMIIHTNLPLYIKLTVQLGQVTATSSMLIHDDFSAKQDHWLKFVHWLSWLYDETPIEGGCCESVIYYFQHQEQPIRQVDSFVNGYARLLFLVVLDYTCDLLEGRSNTIVYYYNQFGRSNLLQYCSIINITITGFQMYELPTFQREPLTGPQHLQQISKIMQYFYNKLPSNFAMGGHLLYGECQVQHSSNLVPNTLINPKRKRCRYISNNQQLLLMYVQPQSGIFGFTKKIGKANWVRILYTHVLAVKISTYYSAIMIVFIKGGIQQLSNDRIQRQAVIIQPTQIGDTRGEQIRYHIVKCVSKNAGSQISKLNQHCDKTLLDYQMYKEITKGNMKSKYIVQQNNTVTQAEISSIKVINLKKMVQEVSKSMVEDNHIEEASQIKSSNDVMKIYRVYKKQACNMESECYKMYIAERKQSVLSNKNNKIQSDNLLSLKIISKSLLSQLPGLLYQIYNECRAYQQYQLITPYVPVLMNCLSNTKNDDFPYLIMQYKYFELHSLAELIKKDKITLSRKEPLKQFLAQLITAIGHVHQCGYLCGSHMFRLQKVGLNWDGHVSLCHLDGFVNLKRNQQGSKKRELVVEGVKLQNFEQKVINMAPEQLKQNQEQTFVQDWWYLGMLIHEFITGSHIFEGHELEAEKQLCDQSSELNLTMLTKYSEEHSDLFHLVRNLLIKDPLRRLGWKNDYHTVLDVPYFKGIDKKKLMKRQGESIINTRTKMPKPDKQIKDLDLWPNDLKKSPKNYNNLSSADVNKVLKACEFQRDFQIQ